MPFSRNADAADLTMRARVAAASCLDFLIRCKFLRLNWVGLRWYQTSMEMARCIRAPSSRLDRPTGYALWTCTPWRDAVAGVCGAARLPVAAPGQHAAPAPCHTAPSQRLDDRRRMDSIAAVAVSVSGFLTLNQIA